MTAEEPQCPITSEIDVTVLPSSTHCSSSQASTATLSSTPSSPLSFQSVDVKPPVVQRRSTLSNPSSHRHQRPPQLNRLMSEPTYSGHRFGGEEGFLDSSMVPECCQENVNRLMMDKKRRRTLQLLCSVIESRPGSWRDLSTARFADQTDFSLPSPTISLSPQQEEIQGSCQPEDELIDTEEDDDDTAMPQLEGVVYELPSERDINYLPVPENISFEVREAARKLIEFFEKRYSDKVGSLLEDALQITNLGPPESPPTGESGSSPHSVNTGSLQPESSEKSPCKQRTHHSITRENLRVARMHYRTVLRELFANQVNWGRIIAMFSFLRALCHTLEQSRSVSATSSHGGSQVWNASSDVVDGVHHTSTAILNPLSTSSVAREVGSVPPIINIDPGSPSPSFPFSVDQWDRRAVHYLIWTTEYIHEDEKLWSWIEHHNNWEGLVTFEAHGDDKLRSQFVRALMSIGGVLLGTLGFAAALRFLSRRF